MANHKTKREVPDLHRGLLAAKPLFLTTGICSADIIPEVAMKFVTFKAMADECAVIVVKLMCIRWLD